MKNQRQAILNLLKSKPNEWVPVYELAHIALQYNTRINELQKEGYKIETKDFGVVNGARHTARRLVVVEQQETFLFAQPEHKFTNVPD